MKVKLQNANFWCPTRVADDDDDENDDDDEDDDDDDRRTRGRREQRVEEKILEARCKRVTRYRYGPASPVVKGYEKYRVWYRPFMGVDARRQNIMQGTRSHHEQARTMTRDAKMSRATTKCERSVSVDMHIQIDDENNKDNVCKSFNH